MKRTHTSIPLAAACLLLTAATSTVAADRFGPLPALDIECYASAPPTPPVDEACTAPFDAVEREFPEMEGRTQRICATQRLETPAPTILFQDMMLEQVEALCDMWDGMPRSSPMFDREAALNADTASIRAALTDLEVLLEDTLSTSLVAIDNLFNSADNAIQDAVNPMFNLIDGEICPGDCWPTNPVNVPNLNLPNSLTQIDFAPFESVVDIAELIVENPDSISLMCESLVLKELYRDSIVATLPTVLRDLYDTYEYNLAESTCATMGGHVCSAPELFQLADGATPGTLGSFQGDWVQGGDVIAAPNSNTRQLFETPWPPVEIDLSPLLSVPPGIPFAISWPIEPTGGFRCCQSTVDF